MDLSLIEEKIDFHENALSELKTLRNLISKYGISSSPEWKKAIAPAPQPELQARPWRLNFKPGKGSKLNHVLEQIADYPDSEEAHAILVSTLQQLNDKDAPELFWEFMYHCELRVSEKQKTQYRVRGRLISFSQMWDRIITQVRNRTFMEVPLKPEVLSPDEFQEQILGRWLLTQWERDIPLITLDSL